MKIWSTVSFWVISAEQGCLTEVMERTHVPYAVCSQSVSITRHHLHPPVAIQHPFLNTRICSKGWSQQEHNMPTKEKQNNHQWSSSDSMCCHKPPVWPGAGQAWCIAPCGHLNSISPLRVHGAKEKHLRRQEWFSPVVLAPAGIGTSFDMYSHQSKHGPEVLCIPVHPWGQ